MSKQIEEHQRLIDNLEIQPQNVSMLAPSPIIFRCNKCNTNATDPILCSCGHLFCWGCIKKLSELSKNKYLICSVCGQSDEIINGRMIFNGSTNSGNSEKPKPQNLQPIRNPSGIKSEGVESYRIMNNIENHKKLAGFTMMPPSFVQIFNSIEDHEQQLNQPQKSVLVVSKCIKNSLILVLVLTFLGFMLNFFIL